MEGAFMSLLNCEKFVVGNISRMKWLFGDECCRNFMSSHSTYTTQSSLKDKGDGHILELYRKVQMSYLCHQICQRVNFIFDLSPLMDQVFTSGSESDSRMHELLLLLRKVRNVVSTWEDSSPMSTEICKKLVEYIILVTNVASDQTRMARALVENIIAWAHEQFSRHDMLEDAPTVQPRRDVAKATLLPPTHESLTQCSLLHARRVAFQVFKSRVMSLAEWHEKYFDKVSDLDQANDVPGISNESAFFFAVYELVHCGFVRKLATGKRRAEAYEKIAIVWGNG